MKRVTPLVLMLCLALSGAFSYAHGVARTEKKEGTPIEVKQKVIHGTPDKGGSILPTINGHYLTVAFSENLGQVAVEITTTSGSPVDYLSLLTPNGLQFYITFEGDYTVTFTLPNGDEYYGEFTVTD